MERLRGSHRRHRTALGVAVVGLALLAAACGSDDEPSSTPTATTRGPTAAERQAAQGDAGHRATVRGTATLDGAPFDADFLGAEVRADGLATPCQATLPAVDGGRYEVQVYATVEGEGCGRPGAEIVLWTFASDQRLWSTTTVPWPGDGETATFDAAFATATPQGVAPPVTELAGEVRDASGNRVDTGTTVEALVGETVCGLSTTRDFNDEAVTFSLSVVGPDARPGCDRDQPITFRVDGKTATQTVPNDGGTHQGVELTLASGA